MKKSDLNEDEVKQIVAFVIDKCAQKKAELGNHYLLTIIASLIATAAHGAAPEFRVIIWDTIHHAMKNGNTISAYMGKSERHNVKKD